GCGQVEACWGRAMSVCAGFENADCPEAVGQGFIQAREPRSGDLPDFNIVVEQRLSDATRRSPLREVVVPEISIMEITHEHPGLVLMLQATEDAREITRFR